MPLDDTLDALRRDIDGIDTALLALLERRFETSARIKAIKGTSPTLPVRPAREFSILSSLMEKAGSSLPTEMILALWRVILSTSTKAQAPVQLLSSEAVLKIPRWRALLDGYFFSFPIQPVTTNEEVIAHVLKTPFALGVLPLDGPWPALSASSLQVFMALDETSKAAPPGLFVVGQADLEPSGCDISLFFSKGPCGDMELSPHWRYPLAHGGTLVGFSGFHPTLPQGTSAPPSLLPLGVYPSYLDLMKEHSHGPTP